MSKRPAKPVGREARPRFPKKKSAPMLPAKSAAPKSLSKLGREFPTIEEFNQIDREVLTAHDRAVVILLATQVERFLELAIISHLPRNDDDTIEVLVGRDGPLGSFNAKIWLAYALGIITDFEKSDLDGIRKIRNAFAHAVRPISFKTEQIASLIDGLNAAKGFRADASDDSSVTPLAKAIAGYIVDNPHRVKFSDACRKLSVMVLRAGRRGS